MGDHTDAAAIGGEGQKGSHVSACSWGQGNYQDLSYNVNTQMLWLERL